MVAGGKYNSKSATSFADAWLFAWTIISFVNRASFNDDPRFVCSSDSPILGISPSSGMVHESPWHSHKANSETAKKTKLDIKVCAVALAIMDNGI